MAQSMSKNAPYPGLGARLRLSGERWEQHGGRASSGGGQQAAPAHEDNLGRSEDLEMD